MDSHTLQRDIKKTGRRFIITISIVILGVVALSGGWIHSCISSDNKVDQLEKKIETLEKS